MSETSSRLLELLSLLQARRDWPGGELADRLGVTRRTIRRDIERLRELGYPIESLAGPAGGYRLGAGTEMPPLLLEDDEAIAIAVGLRSAAGAAVEGIEEASIRALVKLEQVLPSRLRPRLRALRSASTIPVGGPTVDPHCLTILGSAARDSERVVFAYSDREGNRTRRDVEPHALVNSGRRWYVVCWDLKREDWRSFRVDRISRPSAVGVRFNPRELPVKDPAEFVKQSISSMPTRYEAVLVLKAPADELRKRFNSGWGKLKAIDDETCEWRSGDDDLDWLAVRTLMLGVDFEVREPPELAEHLAALGARAARAGKAL